MDQITVVYSRSRSIGGLLIRAASWWEQWTHCGIVTEDYSVIEARAFHGVVETPWDEFRDRYTTLERVRVNCPAPQSGIAWARSRLGSGYDYGALAEIVLRNPMQDGDRYQCAELVESALIAASRFRFRKQPHQVTVAQSYMVR